jgi:hypothetical protein
MFMASSIVACFLGAGSSRELPVQGFFSSLLQLAVEIVV